MKSGSQPVRLIAATVAALTLGTAAAEFLSLTSGSCLLLAWGFFVVSVTLARLQQLPPRICIFMRLMTVIAVTALLAAARWSMMTEARESSALHRLAQRDSLHLILDVDIASIPVEFERPTSQLDASRDTNRWQTRFTADCAAVRIGDRRVTAEGSIRVFIDGQAAGWFRRGDTVRMTGRLSWPQSPGNPGEFDFAAFLNRRGCTGMFFVAHPGAVRILQQAGMLTPGYWLTRLRRAAQSALDRSVDPKYHSIAAALLLGSRSEIRADTEDVFIGSGTMHLLAISGLHIGILCLLLIRIGHCLLIPWNRLLILIALFCIFYAFLTDLRPSVVRATIFAVLFAVSQVTLRHVSLFTIIGQTATLMLLWQPDLVFDTGAWLSFLSVMGLAWATRSVPLDIPHDTVVNSTQERIAPFTPREHMQKAMLQIRHWLVARYRPMLWILAATIPLTAWEFHVVSPVGLVINVFLISWTMLTLWMGFGAIVMGILIPFVPNLPGIGFSWMLAGLTSIVEASARVGVGHIYLADLPVWFLPAWYSLLLLIVTFEKRRTKQQVLWLCLCGVTSATLWEQSNIRSDGHLHCTILDIGHGSAAVVELPAGGVMLVDAGAMNRGVRAGELVSRYLWKRGHRVISSIVVSHADVDHFNALGKVLPRFSVGELLLSQQFLHSESLAAQQLVRLAAQHRVPVRVVGNDERLSTSAVEVLIRQASPRHLANARSDNEKSLVVEIKYGGRKILLPGDLEDAALDDVLPRLSCASVLVSPHHGSLRANTPAVARRLTPEHVIVSARDDGYRCRLSDIYSKSRLRFTSSSGAVQVNITASGNLSVNQFRDSEN